MKRPIDLQVYERKPVPNSLYMRLTSEEKMRGAVNEAFAEMPPKWVEAMRTIPPHIKLERSAEMWRWAREIVSDRVVSEGFSGDDARRETARRLLISNDW